MYTIEQLENLLKCTYPSQVSVDTQNKRLKNIQAIQALIGEAKRSNRLVYQSAEERLHIFTTQAGEKVYIQYPGKESSLTGDKHRPYDFRPKIITADGQELRDLVFADMWRIVEDLNTEHHRILKLMATLFFRLGRMTLHRDVEQEYICESLDANGNVVYTTNRHLRWFQFDIGADIMESLNFHAEGLHVDEGITISLEAFLCFFELLLQNEDSKYYDKKGDLTSGRIPTSDSMLLLSATLLGHIKLSVLLQRFVSGFGIAHCGISEIEPATDGLVRIVDRKSDISGYFDSHNIAYRSGSYITIRGQRYRALLKTTTPKVAVLASMPEEAELELRGAGWNVFDINTLTEDTEYRSFLSLYEAT